MCDSDSEANGYGCTCLSGDLFKDDNQFPAQLGFSFLCLYSCFVLRIALKNFDMRKSNAQALSTMSKKFFVTNILIILALLSK